MLDDNKLKGMMKNAREGFEKRNFTQSAELTLILKDIDVKKGFSVTATPCTSCGLTQMKIKSAFFPTSRICIG